MSAPAAAWGHGEAFVLARCGTDASGQLSLRLTVDYGRHPVLTDKSAAVAAMRQVLRLETPAGPVALDSLASGAVTEESTPDPGLPLPPDPMEAGQVHRLVVLDYVWQPGGDSVRFSVPDGNPHDVLFWLEGKSHPPQEPVPWSILIAGDVTPPVPVPVAIPPPRPGIVARSLLAGGVALALGILVWWRRSRVVQISRE